MRWEASLATFEDMARIKWAAATDPTRFVLNCVLVQVRGAVDGDPVRVVFTATDSYMAVRRGFEAGDGRRQVRLIGDDTEGRVLVNAHAFASAVGMLSRLGRLSGYSNSVNVAKRLGEIRVVFEAVRVESTKPASVLVESDPVEEWRVTLSAEELGSIVVPSLGARFPNVDQFLDIDVEPRVGVVPVSMSLGPEVLGRLLKTVGSTHGEGVVFTAAPGRSAAHSLVRVRLSGVERFRFAGAIMPTLGRLDGKMIADEYNAKWDELIGSDKKPEETV